MSAQGHAHSTDDHDDHADDADEHHAEPPPEEPKSPGWLPLLGGGLFLGALLLFLATRSAEPAEPEVTAPSATAEPAAPPPP